MGAMVSGKKKSRIGAQKIILILLGGFIIVAGFPFIPSAYAKAANVITGPADSANWLKLPGTEMTFAALA